MLVLSNCYESFYRCSLWQRYIISSNPARAKHLSGADFYDLTTFCKFDKSNCKYDKFNCLFDKSLLPIMRQIQKSKASDET